MAGKNLRDKYLAGFSGCQKGGHNNNNPKRVRPQLPKGERESAQQATRDNQMVLVLVEGRHRRFMRLADWEAMQGA